MENRKFLRLIWLVKLEKQADNLSMKDLLAVLKAVLTNPKVIAAAIICFVVMDFAAYICRYRKKPQKRRIKKIYAPPAPSSPETSGTDGAENTDNGGQA